MYLGVVYCAIFVYLARALLPQRSSADPRMLLELVVESNSGQIFRVILQQ